MLDSSSMDSVTVEVSNYRRELDMRENLKMISKRAMDLRKKLKTEKKPIHLMHLPESRASTRVTSRADIERVKERKKQPMAFTRVSGRMISSMDKE